MPGLLPQVYSPGSRLLEISDQITFNTKRTILILGVAIFISWLESALEPWIPIAGLIGVMAIGFIILEKSEPIAHVISQRLKKIWVFAELLLFVLVDGWYLIVGSLIRSFGT